MFLRRKAAASLQKSTRFGMTSDGCVRQQTASVAMTLPVHTSCSFVVVRPPHCAWVYLSSHTQHIDTWKDNVICVCIWAAVRFPVRSPEFCSKFTWKEYFSIIFLTWVHVGMRWKSRGINSVDQVARARHDCALDEQNAQKPDVSDSKELRGQETRKRHGQKATTIWRSTSHFAPWLLPFHSRVMILLVALLSPRMLTSEASLKIYLDQYCTKG